MLIEKSVVREAIKRTEKKVKDEQKGITTFFDNLILQEGIHFLEENPSQESENTVLRRALFTLNTGNERFAEIPKRISNMSLSDLDGFTRTCSQGVKNVMQWRGKPLFKSVYDLAIYQMLINEIRPATIIEIGSTEASLCWLKDMSDLYKLQARIIGIDHVKPETLPDGVGFRKGNVLHISNLLSSELIKNLPRPFLIIEDAHVHLQIVLHHLDQVMSDGDYLVIEDSLLKQQSILKWSAKQDNNYYIDTRYTDFFGINGTTAANSILIKRGTKL